MGDAIRVKIGAIEYRKFGPLFMDDTWPDDTEIKVFHPECLPLCSPDVLRLDGCVVCEQQFYPEESVLWLELGSQDDDGNFRPRYGGPIHYVCACDDWEIPVWQMD